MPRPPIDLARKVKDIIQHVQALPVEAGTPLAHYQRTSTDLWNSILYVERAFSQPGLYRAVAERHLGRINSMVLINLIENFERFLKETAATCVDRLANYVLDDRLNIFDIQGSGLASHFGTATLGRSLCESGTWLNCEEINVRFRRLLSDPFQQGGVLLQPEMERRHTRVILQLGRSLTMRKTRKNYTPVEKVAILRRHLIDRVPVSDLCDEHQLSPTLFYLWQKQFFEGGTAAFERKNGPSESQHLRTIAALREKLQRKNEVVAELMEEHIQLKKELGEL
jgi:transposase-like protein